MAAARFLRNAARTEWRVLAALMLALCAALGLQNGLGRLDATLYDAVLTLSSRPAPTDTVIIAIDEPSLTAIGRWPWSRSVHTRMLGQLAKSRPLAVGLDLIFAEADGDDQALADAIKRLPTVLPALIETRYADGVRQLKATRPVAAMEAASAMLGHIHLETDTDGFARSIFLREGFYLPPPDTQTWPHFALAMLAVADPAWLSARWPGERNPSLAVQGHWYRDFAILIPYLGSPGSVTRVSYVDVLGGRVPANAFDGKFVLVGATAAGLGDAYPTPVSGHTRLMPGVEISANILAALRNHSTIVAASAWQNALFNLLPVLIVLAGLPRLSPRRALFLSTALLVMLPLLSWLLLKQGIWFAPAAGVLCVAVAYPLWSWRRLEATVRYLGEEFLRMSAEPRVLPEAAGLTARGSDIVESGILAVAAAADRLRQARRFVSDTLESLPNAALVIDLEGMVVIANRVAATHFSVPDSDALRGRDVVGLLRTLAPGSSETSAPDWPALQRLAGDDTPGSTGAASASIECMTHAGSHLLARCARLGAIDGGVAGWIVSFSDITELREAERAREEVLAFLSHDMRSPQSSIIALLELHELDPDDNPKEEVHKRIEQYARRTLTLSEQFLQLARAESKAHEPMVEDLGMIADESVEEAWAAASQKSIRVNLHWDGELLPVLADKPLLLRAVVNLLTNAVKYSPENTQVDVRVAEREIDGRTMHVCEVADQGYGISPENQARLFERYRRFSEPGQPKAQGAGLGMAFVKTVVDKHHGRILVQSEPGKGSTFTIALPPVDA